MSFFKPGRSCFRLTGSQGYSGRGLRFPNGITDVYQVEYSFGIMYLNLTSIVIMNVSVGYLISEDFRLHNFGLFPSALNETRSCGVHIVIIRPVNQLILTLGLSCSSKFGTKMSRHFPRVSSLVKHRIIR